ncbi:hypothetical protein [Paractinoplanes globisporus]|jgi:hypothetical protein|uniref:Uncharacterized protein n=1 Tax=Paractinoplanes globisporus TaxID=113565 RepID=A0ABW6W7R3_9ACTN|nr:hypothetical protein [Actinoplanes globisporus]
MAWTTTWIYLNTTATVRVNVVFADRQWHGVQHILAVPIAPLFEALTHTVMTTQGVSATGPDGLGGGGTTYMYPVSLQNMSYATNVYLTGGSVP